jgi:hypothetical protein
MSGLAANYPDWRAPVEDGEVLLWPTFDEILGQTTENHRRLDAAHAVKLQNVSLPELRAKARGWMGHGENDRPLIAMGHQAELYHPGVWVKNVLIDRLAKKMGGEAIHFSIDTDAPKHLQMKWPGNSLPVTDDARLNSAAWSGLLTMPTPRHLRDLQGALEKAEREWNFQPDMYGFFDSMRGLLNEEVDLASALTNTLHRMDMELGLRNQATVVSPIFYSPAYLVFVHHVMARAGEFAGEYNAALAEHRRIYNLKGNTRPMPDLKIGTDDCEVPFWCDDLGGGVRGEGSGVRSRAKVRAISEGWVMSVGGSEFVFKADANGWEAAGELEQWLRQNQIRLSPRALTLTMFLRLVVADQFVHGIGGGRYDQINDRLIARYFGIEEPKFAVTTATMYFPQALGRSRVCLPCIRQEGHRLQHRLLGEKKMEIVRAIEELPRHSLQRRELFGRMREELNAAATENGTMTKWQEKYEQAKRTSEADEGIFDRELFYGLQSRERLMEMIGKYTRE